MYKVIVDDVFIRDQAKEMAKQLSHHTFEHMKLLIEEAIKSPLDDAQKKQVINIFIEEFLKKANHAINDLYEEAKKYLTERMTENSNMFKE